MIEDTTRRAAADGDDRWIESLGLTAEGEELIQHSLDVADEVIRRTESVRAAAPSTRAGHEASGAREEPGRVREGPEPVVAEPPLQPPAV